MNASYKRNRDGLLRDIGADWVERRLVAGSRPTVAYADLLDANIIEEQDTSSGPYRTRRILVRLWAA